MLNSNVDPVLIKASKEIEQILVKYSVGGACSLVSKTHGEIMIHVPEWTAIKIDHENNIATAYIDERIYKTKEERMQIVKLTSVFCVGCQNGLDDLATNMQILSQGISEGWDIRYEDVYPEKDKTNITYINRYKKPDKN
jgi:hypothetical protein